PHPPALIHRQENTPLHLFFRPPHRRRKHIHSASGPGNPSFLKASGPHPLSPEHPHRILPPGPVQHAFHLRPCLIPLRSQVIGQRTRVRLQIALQVRRGLGGGNPEHLPHIRPVHHPA